MRGAPSRDHRGELVIEGSDATYVTFPHADGSDYGRPVKPLELEVQTKVFAALKQLGFREDEVRKALSQLRRESQLRSATPERLLREALVRIRTCQRGPERRQRGARAGYLVGGSDSQNAFEALF